MKKYSIREIEKLTGIKAHTIRIWEQRYALVTPHRTETNIRYYDEDQLKKLINVALLVEHGHKISNVSALNNDEFKASLKALYENGIDQNQSLDFRSSMSGLIIAMLEINEQKFEKIFHTYLLKHGIQQTITELIYPFIQRMSVMWRIGEVSNAQERFMYNLIRQKIIIAIDALPLPEADAKTFILFLPESEFSDICILLATYLLKVKGYKIVNLGQDIAVQDLIEVSSKLHPHAFLTFITVPSTREPVQQYLNELGEAFKEMPVFIAGSVDFLDELHFAANMEPIHDLQNLDGIKE